MKMKILKTNAREARRKNRRLSAIGKFIGNIRSIMFAVLFTALLNFACESPSLKKPGNAQTAVAVEDKQARFESDLQTMKTANLQYVFVFRRKDGGAFDGEDKKYLRANLPVTNRVILADEDKAVIVGSNYKFPPENLDALQVRFNLQDYSTVREEAQ